MANLVSPLSGIPAQLAEIQAAYRRLPPPNQLAWYDELLDISSRIRGVMNILENVRMNVVAEADTIGRNSAANILAGLSQKRNRTNSNRSRNRNNNTKRRRTNYRQRNNVRYNANTEYSMPNNYYHTTRVSQ